MILPRLFTLRDSSSLAWLRAQWRLNTIRPSLGAVWVALVGLSFLSLRRVAHRARSFWNRSGSCLRPRDLIRTSAWVRSRQRLTVRAEDDDQRETDNQAAQDPRQKDCNLFSFT